MQADPKTTRTFYIESNESPTTSDSSMPTVSLSPTTVSSPNNESTPLTRAGTLTGKYVGNWTGNLTQKNSQDNSSQQFRLNIKLKNGNVGSKVGETNGYGCLGVLILRGVKSDSIELFANITGGSCISGTITMKLIGDDLIEYKAVFPDSTITVAGLLTRE